MRPSSLPLPLCPREQEVTAGMCLTSTVHNSAEPRWQHCCDLSGASDDQMYVIAVFDQDIAYSYSDYLGFAVRRPEGGRFEGGQ